MTFVFNGRATLPGEFEVGCILSVNHQRRIIT
jgi:hypothetical protein